MKVNELMIGDWVRMHYPFDMDIDMRPERINILTKGVDFDCEPIPLTAEILEKNGFSKTTEAEFNYYQMPDDCFEIDINHVGCAYSVDVIIKYVHQLQHALRLCGIDKEIVL